MREESIRDEVDFRNQRDSPARVDSFSDLVSKRTLVKDDYSFNSNSENVQSKEIDKLSFYEKQYKLKTEQKINSLVSNLSNHLNEINEESNIKLSEIRQNFFISKLRWLERYNHEWDDQYNQITSKPSNYDVDQSVKSKLEKVEQDRIEILNGLFKLRIKKLRELYGELETIYDELNCKFKAKHLKATDSFEQIIVFKQKFELLLEKSTPENLSEIIVQEAKQQLVDPAYKLAENARIELEEQLKKNEQQAKTRKEEEKLEDKKPVETAKQATVPSDYEGFVGEDDLKLYIEMRKYKIDLEESIKPFTNDPQYKQYRSNLTLFIKTTVNSLSSNSQEHIRDKIDRYSRLFSGQNVNFRDKPLSINGHAAAFNYCIYHTANSFLVTGLKQVLASTKSAYSFAQVMVFLWIRFEEFGKILLAFFFEMCPYIVPFYPTKDAGDDEITYRIACGYSLNKDGSIEDEEVFLNKMRALIKLYASMIQIQASANPLNARSGWKWLASILHLEPCNSVSPAVLHSFLSIVDSRMKSTYGKQFVKLVRHIKSIYLPKVNALKLSNPQAQVQLGSYVDELLKSF